MKNPKTYIYTIIGICLAIVAGGILSIYTNQNNPETVIEKQLTLLRLSQVPKTYYLYMSDSYQESHTPEGYVQWINEHPILSSHTEMKHFFTKPAGEKTKVAFDLVGVDGTEHPVLYEMIQDTEGDWKINTLQVMPTEKNEVNDAAVIKGAVKRLMSLLKQGKIEPAYNLYLSKSFKDAVTYEQFTNTLAEYPQLTKHEALDIDKVEDDEGLKHVTAMALYGSYYGALDFWFTGEQGKWKVWAMEVDSWTDEPEEEEVVFEVKVDEDEIKEDTSFKVEVDESPEIETVEVDEELAFDENLETYDTDIPGGDDFDVDPDLPSDPELLKEVVENIEIASPKVNPQEKLIQKQLDLIKSGDISKAYNDLTSTEFKQVTSLEEFTKFVKNYPELNNFEDASFISDTKNGKLHLIKTILVTDKGESKVDFWLSDENGEWKIFGLKIEESAYYPPLDEAEKSALLQIIKDQLRAIETGDISKAYYAFSSQDFQTNTPFDGFEKFIESYPIFKSENRIMITSASSEGKLRLMSIALSSMSETAEVDYRLVEEDGKWKIWGMQILANAQTAPKDVDAIKAVINEQMDAIRAKDISKAYYAYTSRQFQEAASPEVFKKYLSKEEELNDNSSIEIKNIEFKNNIANTLVIAKGKKGGEKAYNFRLIFDKDQWKVLGIRVHTEVATSSKPSLMQIEKIDVGTKVDLQGKVLNSAVTFTPEDKTLSVNVQVKDALPNDNVTVKLEHVDSSSFIQPVTASVDKRGSAILKFVFTAPTQGWPTGLYILNVEGSSDSYQFLEFKVQDSP